MSPAKGPGCTCLSSESTRALSHWSSPGERPRGRRRGSRVVSHSCGFVSSPRLCVFQLVSYKIFSLSDFLWLQQPVSSGSRSCVVRLQGGPRSRWDVAAPGFPPSTLRFSPDLPACPQTRAASWFSLETTRNSLIQPQPWLRLKRTVNFHVNSAQLRGTSHTCTDKLPRWRTEGPRRHF